MLYLTIVILGLALTVIALMRESAYVAGLTAFATATFTVVQPAYHVGLNWATLWLPVTVFAFVRAIRFRSTWSRVALILSAGFLTLTSLEAAWWTLLFTTIAVVFAFMEGERGTKFWKTLAATSVAVATLAMVLSGGLILPHSRAAAAEAGNPQSLTIRPGDLLPDEAKCGADDTFNRNSMPGTKGRLWVDSVSTPFTAASADTQLTELTRETCVNPTLGDAYIKALSDAKIGDFSIAQANPWMREFLDRSSGTDGLKVWLTHKASDTEGLYVTGTNAGDYQYYAQMTNAVILVLENQGTKTATSTVNWPLGSLVADTLPRVYEEKDPNKQEANKPFLALTFTSKTGGCPLVLAVNDGDKRPANVGCEEAKTIAPPVPTQSKPPTITPTTPTKPDHKPTPSTPSGPPSTTPTSPPATCVWSNGTVHNLDHGVCPKDPNPLQTNPYHTPAASPSGPAKPPVHPSETANPSTTPGSGSTQTAPGASKPPTPSTPAPSVGPTGTATGCVNPITHQSC